MKELPQVIPITSMYNWYEVWFGDEYIDDITLTPSTLWRIPGLDPRFDTKEEAVDYLIKWKMGNSCDDS